MLSFSSIIADIEDCATEAEVMAKIGEKVAADIAEAKASANPAQALENAYNDIVANLPAAVAAWPAPTPAVAPVPTP